MDIKYAPASTRVAHWRMWVACYEEKVIIKVSVQANSLIFSCHKKSIKAFALVKV